MANMTIFPVSLARSVASAVAASPVGGKSQAGCVAVSQAIGAPWRLRIIGPSGLVVDAAYQSALPVSGGAITLPAYTTLISLISASIVAGWKVRIGRTDDSVYVEGGVGGAASSQPFKLTADPSTSKGFAVSELVIRFDPALDASAGGSVAERDAWVESMIYDAQNAPDFQTIASGHEVPAKFGGHLHTSFASMQQFGAQWTTTPPFPEDPPGGSGLKDYSASSGPGMAEFLNNVACIVPWFWVWPLAGDAASNTCVEVRDGYAGMLTSSDQWVFTFRGARFGASLSNVQVWALPRPSGVASSQIAMGLRGDGLTSWFKPHGNTGIETWPIDTSPSRGVISFLGGSNRAAMVGAKTFIWGCRARLALINPLGTDDIGSARIGLSAGADFFAPNGRKHYDQYGFPYGAADGGHDRWKRLLSREWTWVTGWSLGVGVDGHWMHPGTPPPIGGPEPWQPDVPWTGIADGRSISPAMLRANPPPLPFYQ